MRTSEKLGTCPLWALPHCAPVKAETERVGGEMYLGAFLKGNMGLAAELFRP